MLCYAMITVATVTVVMVTVTMVMVAIAPFLNTAPVTTTWLPLLLTTEYSLTTDCYNCPSMGTWINQGLVTSLGLLSERLEDGNSPCTSISYAAAKAFSI